MLLKRMNVNFGKKIYHLPKIINFSFPGRGEKPEHGICSLPPKPRFSEEGGGAIIFIPQTQSDP